MKIQYIGTGAAEGFPGMFCGCPACERARRIGGRNLKTRSCAMINDNLLIDLSPDLYARASQLGLRLWKVKDLVMTHSHCDHFDGFSLALRARDGAAILPEIRKKENFLSVYGSSFIERAIEQALREQPHADRKRINYVPVETGKWFQAGGIWFYPLKASHKPDELCFIYAVTDGRASFLYANDTGRLADSVIREIGSLGLVFDAVSMDCARGSLPGDGHMGMKENLDLKNSLMEMGCVSETTAYYLNHLSHMSGMIHDDLQAKMGPEGFTVAYDGLILEI
ncbi:hypothetical protein GPL15_21310 [Clostridium sp. MCC353]|uniref:MBL fold metallo-hydrolase n=1 Tax=Clostridium sp. MCC353 TaxID=2592646 RepID=UPI001C018E79|nr:MBL fold metallo-hydrolase [Clostridium sp. MCC353]MBT9779020.1 hypothetical protein [Clostridium sp. MCC353]